MPLGIFSEATDGTMCPGVNSASKNEYQDTPGGEGGRCVRVTTLPHSQCQKLRRSRSLNLLEPQEPLQACSGKPLPFTCPTSRLCNAAVALCSQKLTQNNISSHTSSHLVSLSITLLLAFSSLLTSSGYCAIASSSFVSMISARN